MYKGIRGWMITAVAASWVSAAALTAHHQVTTTAFSALSKQRTSFIVRRSTRQQGLPFSSSSILNMSSKKSQTKTCNNYYLLKSEPTEFSIQQLQQQQPQQEEWDGVRNYAARNHLQSMQVGDRCFFYHSSCPVPSIVGTCRIAREAQPDATAAAVVVDDDRKSTAAAGAAADKKNPWVSVMVELEQVFDDTPPITIKELRAQATVNPIIANMTLLKQSRLSVMPVTRDQWEAVLELQRRKEQGEDLLLSLGEEVTKNKGANKRSKSASAARDDAKPITTAAAVAAAAKKLKRNAAASNKNNDISNVDDAGYCSSPDRALSSSHINAIVHDDDVTTMAATKITEKDLGLAGRKHLYQFVEKEDEKGHGVSTTTTTTLVHYFEGGKFIGKDMDRMTAMVEAAQKQQDVEHRAVVYLLLSEQSGICKRNTLPKLIREGVIVQRVG